MHVEEHVVICHLIHVLDQVIKNKTAVNHVGLNREVTRPEYMLNVVRSQSMHIPWDLMVQRTSQLVKEGSLSDTFYKMMKEMNSSNVSHLLTLYALFVDVVSYLIQSNNAPVDTLIELRRLHYYIHITLGASAMKSAMSILTLYSALCDVFESMYILKQYDVF